MVRHAAVQDGVRVRERTGEERIWVLAGVPENVPAVLQGPSPILSYD